MVHNVDDHLFILLRPVGHLDSPDVSTWLNNDLDEEGRCGYEVGLILLVKVARESFVGGQRIEPLQARGGVRACQMVVSALRLCKREVECARVRWQWPAAFACMTHWSHSATCDCMRDCGRAGWGFVRAWLRA
jgi:hypothetical protein